MPGRGVRSENTGEGRGSGHRGPAPGHAFGIASVTQALEGASFPMSKEELIEAFGDAEVHWTKNSSGRLSTILEQTPQDEFMSIADVASAESEACRERGTGRG